MKKSFLLFLSIILFTISYSQKKITPTEWQQDLRFLQQTVHSEYSFLFKNVTAKDFDREVDKLHKDIPSMQDHEILAGLARIVSLFKYGHTNIGWRESPVKYHIIPLNLYWFSDGVYVEGADNRYADIVGSKLYAIEGMPVEKAIAAIKPLVPAENDQYLKAYGLDFLVIPEALHAQKVTRELKSEIVFSFEKDGKKFDRKIPSVNAFRFPRDYGFVKEDNNWISARNHANTPLYLKALDKNYHFEYLPENKTAYVRQSQVLDDAGENLQDFYKRVFDFIDKNDVEKMVLDLRLNGGGNNYKNKPVVTGIIESKKINQPGKLFVIIGRRTFSACQNLVNELSNYTNALFVGEPTSENINFYGDTRRVALPKTGMPIYLSFAWWQDKPQWENGPWLAPQVAVDQSYQEYINNEDPLLTTCLQLTDRDIVLNPMAPLRQLYEAGKLDELESQAKKMIADPKYRYVSFESEINRAGYEMLNAKKNDAALYIFQLNSRLFPASPNVWDSLAEACLNSKQKDKAIEYYKKAVEMDPKGITGQNARRMLSEIQGR